MAHPEEHAGNLPMRKEHNAMALSRLGCHYPSRLSFMRVLTRTMLRDQWSIEQTTCRLDENGVGEILYTVITLGGLYTFVAFAHDVRPDINTDRSNSEHWDLTAVLCAGPVDAKHLGQLRESVSQQEKGRLDGRALVLTRGNQSSKSFNYVVNCLAKGEQPDTDAIARVGYLYSTTAVYGNGKFGMCDWSKIKMHHTDFNRPFAAELFTCFMLRQVSFDIAEHVAKQRAPGRAIALSPDIKRYFGIGNTAGLGITPFLINHPLLTNQWIECRELALERVRTRGTVDKLHLKALSQLLNRAQVHLSEITSDNEPQNAINKQITLELSLLVERLSEYNQPSWKGLLDSTIAQCMDTQEILISCLMELYPELVDDLADSMGSDESYDMRPEQTLAAFKMLLETRYDWALAIDFDNPDSQRMFWYRCAEKMELHLGEVNIDSGVDRQVHLDIALQASELYEYVCEYLNRHPNDRVAQFLISLPILRNIVRRVQTMAQTSYGEIRANLRDFAIAPTELMRCMLSFFGASKFDPQSRLSVHNTMFQGAPILDDLRNGAVPRHSIATASAISERLDDWSFPIRTKL